jgi:hypothetical protein
VLCRALNATAPTCDILIWLPRACRLYCAEVRGQLLPPPARRVSAGPLLIKLQQSIESFMNSISLARAGQSPHAMGVDQVLANTNTDASGHTQQTELRFSLLSKDAKDIIKSINSQSAGSSGKDAEMANERERQKAAIRCAFLFHIFLNIRMHASCRFSGSSEARH